jgi:hypothetical protein
MTEAGRELNAQGNQVRARCSAVQCDASRCGFPALSEVDGHSYCLSHFIAYCYKKLESHNWSGIRIVQPASTERDNRFLYECARQAADLASPLRGFANIDRARLFDIFLWACDLISHRREPQPQTSLTGEKAFLLREISFDRPES